jgi:hypothetical protein
MGCSVVWCACRKAPSLLYGVCPVTAPQSLNLLSNNPLNIKKLKTGALLALLAELSEHDDTIINQTASMILDNLNDSVNAGLDDFEVPAASAAEAAVAATAAATSTCTVMMPATTTKKSATYLNTIPLTIASLKGSAAQGAVLEKMLVKQAGVVSVSVDAAHNRITVYSNMFFKDQCAPLLAALDVVRTPLVLTGAYPFPLTEFKEHTDVYVCVYVHPRFIPVRLGSRRASKALPQQQHPKKTAANP